MTRRPAAVESLENPPVPLSRLSHWSRYNRKSFRVSGFKEPGWRASAAYRDVITDINSFTLLKKKIKQYCLNCCWHGLLDYSHRHVLEQKKKANLFILTLRNVYSNQGNSETRWGVERLQSLRSWRQCKTHLHPESLRMVAWLEQYINWREKWRLSLSLILGKCVRNPVSFCSLWRAYAKVVTCIVTVYVTFFLNIRVPVCIQFILACMLCFERCNYFVTYMLLMVLLLARSQIC